MVELVIENPSSGNIHYRSRRCEVDIRPNTVRANAQVVVMPDDCLDGLIEKLAGYPHVSIKSISQQGEEPESPKEAVKETKENTESGIPTIEDFQRDATAKKDDSGVYVVTYNGLTFEVETDHHKKAKSAAYHHFFGGDKE